MTQVPSGPSPFRLDGQVAFVTGATGGLGAAIVIALAQLEHFKDGGHWLSGAPLYLMIGLVALTMLERGKGIRS